MKKLIACLLAICMIFLLTACGGGKKDVDLNALANELTASTAFTMEMGQFLLNDAQTKGTYRYDEADVVSASLYFNNGTAEEIFLAQAKDSSAADRLEQLCKTRVQNQISALQIYNPEAVSWLENAVIKKQGNYVVLVVASDNAAAKTIVDKYFK